MRGLLLLLCAAALCPAQEPLTLADAEAITLERHPSLRKVAAAVDAAEARRKQAGRYPNPTIGATGDELSRVPELRGGEFGAFIEQRIVTGGKLSLEQRVREHERSAAEADLDAQRQRALNHMRALFYAALAAGRLVEVQTRLAGVAREAVTVTRQLANVGQADRPDLLQAEIEAQGAEMALEQARLEQESLWRQLAAAMGDPAMARRDLAGALEELPVLTHQDAIERILAESPELDHAAAEIARAEARVDRERAQVVPDIKAEGGFRHNPAIFIRGQPIGREAFFQVGVDLPLFNRNRAGIAAAKAELEGARAEAEWVKLSLHERLAAVYAEFASSAILAKRYREEMLPRAEEAYRLQMAGFQRMAAAYPQALIAQRGWFELQRDYVRALNRVWQAAVVIEGMLLTGDLDDAM
ncbi:MAG: hypothetical protein GC160_04870 [Acidobacteria bacterium]|nr:hypothetical protein [Acidobacteriota bacterium]